MYILCAKVRRRYNRISRGIGTGCASNIEGGRERLLVPGAYIIIIMQYYILTLDTRLLDPLSYETAYVVDGTAKSDAASFRVRFRAGIISPCPA